MANWKNVAAVFSNESLADRVFTLLEQGIINMEIPPGTILSEDEIAANLKVSRSPVREALLRLEHMGLVNKERKSRTVSTITKEMMMSHYHMWAMTESYGAAEACQVVQAHELARIRDTLNLLEGVLHDTPKYQDYNWLFHSALVQPCPYKKLVELHANAFSHIRWGHNYTLYRNDDIDHSNATHLKIFELYQQKKSEELEALIRAHVKSAAQRFMDKYFKASELS